MFWALGISVLAGSINVAVAAQVAFQSHAQPWNAPPSQDATGALIFQALGGLLQHWPNTRHDHGHSIVPVTVPPGTVLYHGGRDEHPPTTPEWLAFDPEHSWFFAQGDNGHHISFVTTRQLNLIYFDGSSASNSVNGTMDTQDILIWGEVREDKAWDEFERIREVCEWGKPYGIDGYVRMEPDFEIMYCNFTQGLEVVSNINTIPFVFTENYGSEPLDSPPRKEPPGSPPRRPPSTPPRGWKGNLPNYASVSFEFFHAGAWHDFAPGETRLRPDVSSMITFFDPSLTSLVASRRNQSRDQYRLSNISASDAARVRADLVAALGREQNGGSGVDWRGIVQVITDRYSDRLPLLKYILRPPSELSANSTAQASLFRAQLLIMLSPYISRTTVPPHSTAEQDHAWVEPIARTCGSVFTSGIADDVLTPQERVLRNAITETHQEICRVLSLMWADAFAIEEQVDARVIARMVGKWRSDVEGLMAWLDWSAWTTCAPACGPLEICYLPEWPWARRGAPVDMMPRCVSRLPPYDKWARWAT